MRFRILIAFLGSISTLYGQVSHPSGQYDLPFELTFSSKGHQEFYFTTDGSDPLNGGQHYQEAIPIGAEITLPPKIDTIPTTPLEGPWQLDYFRWKEPQKMQRDVWVLRYAICEKGRCFELPPETYFMGEHWKSKHNVPVVSITTDANNLFDAAKGLFVPGNLHTEKGWDSLFFGNGNYTMKGKDWQRPGALQLFDSSLVSIYETPIEFRLHGAVVGAFPQKSIRVYTDKPEGGKALNWSNFNKEDTLSSTRFILRNSGSDMVSTHFRDAYLSSLAGDLGLEHQKSEPCVVYLNGIYWGIYNIRERIDRYYMQEHFGLNRDAYDMIEGTGKDVMNGSNETFVNLLSMIYTEDIQEDSVYAKVEAIIDIENYIDYNLFETYFCNMDWPGNNVKFWRPKNGKWRWIFFDGDLMMSPYVFNKDGGYEHDALAHATADTLNEWYNSKGSTYLLRNLLKNDTFRQQFYQRYSELSGTNFSEDYLLGRLAEFEERYASEMNRQIDRWNYPSDRADWEREVALLKEFLRQRKMYYEAHLGKLLGAE